MRRLLIGWVCLCWAASSNALVYRMNGYVGDFTYSGLNAFCSGLSLGAFFFPDQESIDIYQSQIPGASFEGQCRSDGVTVTLEFTVDVLPNCIANEDAALWNQTTVGAIDEFGQYTAATSPTNPQCQSGCAVSAPSGLTTGHVCSAFRDPTEAWIVGAPVWVSCLGGGATPITKTGESCNMPSADYLAMTAGPVMPLGYVPAGPGEEEPPASGPDALGKPVDTTAVCVDANGNGLDDNTGDACSVQAAAALKVITDGKTSEMTQVGQGATVQGDVVALSNQNGGWFQMPTALGQLLDPPASCAFDFVIPAWAGFGGLTVATGWCAIKTTVEPFLAFAMYILTMFVAFSQFKRVA